MKELLKYQKLRLLNSRSKLILNDTFDGGMNDWKVQGDWHHVTLETNVDLTLGLSGEIAVNCAGSWTGGTMTKEVELNEFGEIVFEYHTENPKHQEEPNSLKFFIDDAIKLQIDGPSPWTRCVPIGITPGKHTLKFTYELQGEPNHKKSIVDTIMIYEAKEINCLITEYEPAKPLKDINSNKIIRSFTRYQEMTIADTEINFTATFDGLNFLHFMQKSDEVFYFVDEFGICYRGIFPENISPKSIAMNEIYLIDLTLEAGQKTGIGFC